MTIAGTITLTVPAIATVHHPVEARLLPAVAPRRLPAMTQDHPLLEATAVVVPPPVVPAAVLQGVPVVGRLRLVLLAVVRTLLLRREAVNQAVVEARVALEVAGHLCNFDIAAQGVCGGSKNSSAAA